MMDKNRVVRQRLRNRARWALHNIVFHPIMEVGHIARDLGRIAAYCGDRFHDRTLPPGDRS